MKILEGDRTARLIAALSIVLSLVTIWWNYSHYGWPWTTTETPFLMTEEGKSCDQEFAWKAAQVEQFAAYPRGEPRIVIAYPNERGKKEKVIEHFLCLDSVVGNEKIVSAPMGGAVLTRWTHWKKLEWKSMGEIKPQQILSASERGHRTVRVDGKEVIVCTDKVQDVQFPADGLPIKLGPGQGYPLDYVVPKPTVGVYRYLNASPLCQP